MTTITGTCENTLGQATHVVIEFKSKSTPLVGAGVVTLNTTKRIRSDPTTGYYEIQLAAGKYDVTFYSSPTVTRFEITVPEGNDTLPIEDVTSSELTFVFSAPNTVWNGQRAGHITFLPIADPGAPSLSEVQIGSGNQGPTDLFEYKLAWVNSSGDVTAAGPGATNTAPTAPNNATRVTFPSIPSGVAYVQIYRSTNDATTNRYLLTTVAATSAYYDDFESTADFNARLNPLLLAPEYNITAGMIYATPGQQVLYFSISGLRCLSSVHFDEGLTIMDGFASWTSGTGSPEGVVAAYPGSIYSRTDGGASLTLYVKESGDADTGWAVISGGTPSITVTTSSSSPEGAITAPVGSIHNEISGGTFVKMWIKVSGTGNTGWA